MRIVRTVKWLTAGAAVLAFAAAGLYIQASRTPPNYSPAILSADQRDRAAKEFLNRKILNDFGNATQRNRPFDWSIGEDELNRYLASMDEIASSAPTVQPGAVHRAMADAGLAAPAVALRNGKLTLMVRSTKYEKILSADLAFTFNKDGMLLVRLVQARSGRLALPDRWLRDRLRRLGQSLDAEDRSARPAAGPAGQSHRAGRSGSLAVSSLDVAELLRVVLAAIDNKPIRPELTWGINERHVRISGIRISDGLLTLHVVPADG